MNVVTPTVPLTVEHLLNELVEAAQPTRDQHQRAKSTYEHVGGWVCDADGGLARYRPTYSPQGSFLLGTVVRPQWQHEFDLDAITRLNIDPCMVRSEDAYNIVADRIAEHGDLRKRMQHLPRCIRLNYAGDFHHDVTPACDDPRPDRALLIASKPEERTDDSPWASWKPTDPYGYAQRFEERNAVLELHARHLAHVAPMPAYISAEYKTPLRKIVQLLKMRRNAFYTPEEVPSSILITTMAAACYQGQTFSLQTNIDVVAAMLQWAEQQGANLCVPNPTIPEENFAAVLSPAAKRRFREFLRTYAEELIRLGATRGLHRYGLELEGMYGTEVKDGALRGVAAAVNSARNGGTLHTNRVAAALSIVTPAAPTVASVLRRANPSHSFHGGRQHGR